MRSVLTRYDGNDCFSRRGFPKNNFSSETCTEGVATGEWNTRGGFEDGALAIGLISANDDQDRKTSSLTP